MGKSIKYNYKNFMLLDDKLVEDNDVHSPMEDFAENVRGVLGLATTSDKAPWRDSYYIGLGFKPVKYENRDWLDIYFIGIDTSGALPCIFLTPEYDDRDEYNADYKDNYDMYLGRMDTYSRELFNKLISAYEPSSFRRPTSSYTSNAILNYPL